MKKLIISLIAVSSLGSVLSGCSSSDQTSKQPTYRIDSKYKQSHFGLNQKEFQSGYAAIQCASKASDLNPVTNAILNRLIKEQLGNNHTELMLSMNGSAYISSQYGNFKYVDSNIDSVCSDIGSQLGTIAYAIVKYPVNFQYNDDYKYAISQLQKDYKILSPESKKMENLIEKTES